MGFWKTAKDEFEKGLDAVEGATYTQEYNAEDTKKIIEGMKNEVRPRTLRRKKLGKAPLDRLDKDEELVYFLKGFDLDIDDNDEGSQSQLMVTDKKVVMLAHSITGKDSQYTVSFNDINGISVQRRMLSHIRIQTAGHSYKISVGGSKPELAEEVIEYIRKRKDEIDSMGKNHQEETALDKLEKLAELNEMGAVSDKEFEEKKEALMDDI